VHQPAAPVVTLQLDRSDGKHVERAAHAADGDFSFATERCDVRIGACTFTGDLHSYRIHVDIDGVLRQDPVGRCPVIGRRSRLDCGASSARITRAS
jgi:hypothetical protein